MWQGPAYRGLKGKWNLYFWVYTTYTLVTRSLHKLLPSLFPSDSFLAMLSEKQTPYSVAYRRIWTPFLVIATAAALALAACLLRAAAVL